MEWSLTCDDPRCTKQRGAAARDDDAALARLLESARAAGWDVDSDASKHWCPEHPQVRP